MYFQVNLHKENEKPDSKWYGCTMRRCLKLKIEIYFLIFRSESFQFSFSKKNINKKYGQPSSLRSQG